MKRAILLTLLSLSVFTQMQAQGWLQFYTDQSFAIRPQALNNGNFWSIMGNQTLREVDQNGNVVQDIPIGARSGLTYVRKVELLPNGNFAVAGQGPQSTSKMMLALLDPNLDTIFTVQLPATIYREELKDMIPTSDGGFLMIGYKILNGSGEGITVVKVDAVGNIAWYKDYATGLWYQMEQLVEQGGAYYMVGGEALSTGLMMKLNTNGDSLWLKEYGVLDDAYFNQILPADDGGLFISGFTRPPAFGSDFQYLLMKVDSDGVEEWAQTYEDTIYMQDAQSGSLVRLNSGFALGGHPSSFTGRPGMIVFTDMLGNETSRKYLSFDDFRTTTSISGMTKTNGNGLLLAGSYNTGGNFAVLMRTDSLGCTITNTIAGMLFQDNNGDCFQSTLQERGLQQWIVEIAGATDTILLLTDVNGEYSATVDTGSYTISVVSPLDIWQPSACSTYPVVINYTNFYSDTIIDIPLEPTVLCPRLEVEIGTPLLRRCFENTFNLSVCNTGTEAEDSVEVTVGLPPELDLTGASQAFDTVGVDSIRFYFGTVQAGECFNINFSAIVNCDSTALGQTLCIEATVSPDTICPPASSAWDGSLLFADVQCTQDSVRFRIANVGTGNMSAPSALVVIEDDIMIRNDQQQLNSLQDNTFSLPATGGTFRVIANQTPDNPYGTFTTDALEGCGTGPISLGFITQFPVENEYPGFEVFCQEVIGAYDPNDKTGYPKGATAAKLIEKNTPLQYRVRFQNTGTDTAFNVYIYDTITPLMDMSTFQAGISSHDYAVEILESRVLKFSYLNIMLPDSNVDEPGSNGYVFYSISQNADLADGNVIENSAAIYFDYNEPVITNTEFHTIGRITMVSVQENTELAGELKAYPNPSIGNTTIDWTKAVEGTKTLEVYDLNGRLLLKKQTAANSFTISTTEMPKGLHLFHITSQQGTIGKGKLMVK